MATNLHSIAIDQQPPDDSPVPVYEDGARIYRDAVVARPMGYRPLTLDLVIPETAGPVPVVVHIYGGGFAMGNHKSDHLGRYLTTQLLPAGYAIAKVQHRHSREAQFPAQLHDVKAAVRWLRHHSAELSLDAGKFAAWGSSSGGHLATMLAVTGEGEDLEGHVGLRGPSSAVQAAVAWNAPVNIARLPPAPPESPFHRLGVDPHDWLLGASAHDRPDLAAAASTATYVSANSAPLLLAHGEEDHTIPVSQSEEIVAAYAAHGVTAELIRVANAGHFFDHLDRARMTTACLRFLDHHLRRKR